MIAKRIIAGAIIASGAIIAPGGIGASAANVTWAQALDARIDDAWRSPEHRAFDFWIGEWEMNWRPPSEETFEHAPEGSWTRQRVFPILGGKAIVELAWARDNPEEASQRGFSIRYYDPAREKWVMAQNWPNARGTGSAFMDQLIGAEHLGRLTMYSQTYRALPDGAFADEHRRYNFADIRPGVSFRWDGSNSADGGALWRTWAVVDAHRKRDLDPFGPLGELLPGVHEEKLCTDEPHGAFDGMEGTWSGEATDAGGGKSPARLSAGRMLDGCGLAIVVEEANRKTFLALGFHDRFERWAAYALSDEPGAPHTYFVAASAGEGAVFAEAPALAIRNERDAYLSTEAFETAGALKRFTVEKIGASQIIVHTETRSEPDGEWRAARTLRLERKD